MAESAAYARRTTKGGCAVAHIPGGLNTGVTGVVACDDLSTWVGATANGPTRVMLNRAGVGPAGSTPEEIEISTLSGNNVTIGARGLQGTSQANHPANSTIEVVSSPRDFDEANAHVSDSRTTAHAAAKISYAGVDNTGTIDDEAATTVEAALDDLFTNKISKAVGTAADSLVMFSASATPVELPVAASRIIGKKAAGGLGALTAAEVKTILAIANTDVSGLGTAATKDTGYTASKIPVLTGSPGTPDGTKFLRDDGTWVTPSAGGGYGTFDVTQVYASGSQTITTGTTTAVLFDTEDYDTSNQHSTVTNTDRITIAATGDFEIDAMGSWDTSATGTRTANITVNGTTVIAPVHNSSGYNTSIIPPFTMHLTAADIVRLTVTHTVGSNLVLFGNSSVQRGTFLRVKRLS